METVRLKNIVIIILALLNAFLLFLIISNQVRTEQAAQEAREQIFALFEKNSISLSPDTAQRDAKVDTLSFIRDTEAEEAFASAILGNVSFTDEGGGIHTYSGESGTASFHTNGTFSISTTGIPISDPTSYAMEFCHDFHYDYLTVNTVDGTGTIQATEYIENMPVLNASLTFTFSRHQLISVTGTYLSSTEEICGESVSLSATSALVNFVDYIVNNGVICNELKKMETAYALQSTAEGIRLVPVWLFTADTFRCCTAEDGNAITQLSS